MESTFRLVFVCVLGTVSALTGLNYAFSFGFMTEKGLCGMGAPEVDEVIIPYPRMFHFRFFVLLSFRF